MMKRLKFVEPLPSKILIGEKTSTWRIDDEKDISVGDELSLCRTDGTEFARAKVLFVKETPFGELTDEDWKGHERYSSDEEMYNQFSKFYKVAVTSKTIVKIIKFELLK